MEFQMETRSLLNIYALVKNLVDFLSDPLPHTPLSLSERWTLINRRARSWNATMTLFSQEFQRVFQPVAKNRVTNVDDICSLNIYLKKIKEEIII